MSSFFVFFVLDNILYGRYLLCLVSPGGRFRIFLKLWKLLIKILVNIGRYNMTKMAYFLKYLYFETF